MVQGGNSMRQDRYEKLLEILEFYGDRLTIDLDSGEIKGIAVCDDGRGYDKVNFSMDGERHSYGVHQVIAVVGGLDVVGKTINHKDTNKKNNKLVNLEAISHKENVEHAKKAGLYQKRKSKNYKMTPAKVRLTRKLHREGFGVDFLTLYFGTGRRTMNAIIANESWKGVV